MHGKRHGGFLFIIVPSGCGKTQCDDRQPEVCCYNKQHKRKILSNQESS